MHLYTSCPPPPCPMHRLPHHQRDSPEWYFFFFFITKGKPSFIRHSHLKSVVYLKVLSRCHTFYGFGQGDNDLSPPWWYRTEHFAALTTLCALPLLPPLLRLLLPPWCCQMNIFLHAQRSLQENKDNLAKLPGFKS